MFQSHIRRVFAPKSGFYDIGRPDPIAPVWLIGNSRAELNHIKRQSLPIPITLALLNTNGLALANLWRGGHLTMKFIMKRLDQLTNPTVTPRHALLPYPLWHALGEEDVYTPMGWAIVAGPATLHDLARYITRGSV